MTSAATATITPMALNTAASKAVASLKCEGTPRQRCMVIKKTSATLATPRGPASSQPNRRRLGRNDSTQPRVSTVIPNEKPNRIGLRHDSGPSHPPPSSRNTTPWTRPLANSSTPAAYRKVW